MLQNNFSVKKSIILFACLLISFYAEATSLLTTHQQVYQQEKPKRKKKSKYEQIFEGKKTETKKSSFLTLHKIDGNILVEMPLTEENQDVLIGATIGAVSNPLAATSGMKNTNPLHFRFIVRDSSVVMKLINTDLIEANQRQNAQQMISKSFSNITMYAFKIKAYNDDKTSVVFDMTSFFMDDNKYYPALTINSRHYSKEYQRESSHTYQIKAFDKNAVIKTEKNYLFYANSNPQEKYPLTIDQVFTIMKLPKEKMIPRASDTRIGVFQNSKYLIDTKESIFQPLTLVNRWKVEPSDVVAYAKGEKVEPKKKIIFYIDNAFPEHWKEPIKKGVLRWNSAFEKIGFKNVIEVRDFESENPNFDPDNLNYSCIRYIARPEENAMGPSWIDPRTGEIINASVFIYGDIAKLIQRWRFVQTAQVDQRIRSKELSPEIFNESIEYVVAHEIGHTLGFMHNMKASSSFAVDSLRNATFSKKYGTTPSIMDYARFNYIAQPGDGDVGLTPPHLGVYDDFLVQWTYQYFPECKGDFIQEAEKLKALIASKENDPHYHYLLQQFNVRIDPSAIEEDLGDDPQKASDYGFSNLKYITKHLDQWITNDEDSYYKSEFYNGIAMQAYMYLSFVNMNIGGVYLLPVSESSHLPRYSVVSKERQQSSVMWLLNKAKELNTYRDSAVEEKIMGVNNYPFVSSIAKIMAVSNILKISASEYLDPNSYTVAQYNEDIFQSVFDKTLKADETLTEDEKELQTIYINYFSKYATVAIDKTILGIQSEQVARQMLNYANSIAEDYFKEHSLNDKKCDLQKNQIAQIKNEKTFENPNFGVGYGEPENLWIQSVDKSLTYILLYTQKAEKLLEQACKNTKDPDLKAHYGSLFRAIQKGLKKNK